MSDDDLTNRFDRMEAQMADLVADNDALRTHVAVLQDRLDRAEAAPPPATNTPAPVADEGRSMGRRSVLTKGLAAAGAATAGAVALAATPAAATDGQPLVVGAFNGSNASTTLSNSGGEFGLIVNGSPSTALSVDSSSPSGVGIATSGMRSNLCLRPRTGNGQPPSEGIAHARGELVVDVYGNLWYCHTSGTPGTWRSLSGPTHAGSFYPWTAPVRAYDSRPGTNPASPGPKTKLAAGQTRTVNLTTSGAASPQSKGVLVQVLLVNAAAGNGNFTIWSGGVPKPLANTLVWGGSTGRFSTLAYASVSTAGEVSVNASLATDLVLDVIGIYG